MDQQELRTLAKLGLDAEIARLTKLRDALDVGNPVAATNGRATQRKRRKFTAAQRREVSKRMKAMWAARKKK